MIVIENEDLHYTWNVYTYNSSSLAQLIPDLNVSFQDHKI